MTIMLGRVYPPMANKTTIGCSESVKEKLSKKGSKGETWDELLTRAAEALENCEE